jgi:hypothetical protein
MPLLYFWHGDNYRRDLHFGAGYRSDWAMSRSGLELIEPRCQTISVWPVFRAVR